ncbi:MAG: hypothetical protein A2Y25_11290 [Candidatus Melainabacteria bacterium GWF2_37_15]|nr:MAG: hypothetical protein A2Y25_11290 [Candidatus Melainabacteria bacterium GWF2_37_15]
MLLGGINMPIKGTSLFASKPVETPPTRSVESTGVLASAPPSIFGGGTETSGTCAFSGGSGGGSTIAVA